MSRKAVSLNTKIQTIDTVYKDKLSVKNVMIKFDVKKTAVYTALKNKEQLKQEWLSGNGKLKRKKKVTANDDINKLVFEWFVSARSRLLPLSGPIVQEYARNVARALGNVKFSASNGWLESFRRSYDINFKEISGEAGDVSEEVVGSWKNKLADLIDGYEAKDIANGDETGLFYRALPSKSLVLKNEKCVGGKLSKKKINSFCLWFYGWPF